MLQIICINRAEVIDFRHDRLLSNLPVESTQADLRRIPPSDKHLFEKENGQSLIESGGELIECFYLCLNW